MLPFHAAAELGLLVHHGSARRRSKHRGRGGPLLSAAEVGLFVFLTGIWIDGGGSTAPDTAGPTCAAVPCRC